MPEIRSTAPCRLCGQPLPVRPELRVLSARGGVLAFLSEASTGDDAVGPVEVFECGACGHVQLAGAPVHYSGLTSVSASSGALLRFRREQLARFVTAFGLARQPVVEVGCGDGHSLSILRELGALPYGVDTSPGAIAGCQVAGHTAQVEIVGADTTLLGAPFAGCVALHVLEHVPDVRAFLHGMRANLAAGGAALIEVPSLEQLVEQRRHIEFFADHLNYFSADTLRRALDFSGFDEIVIERTWYGEHLSATARVRRGVDWRPLHGARDELLRGFTSLLAQIEATGGKLAMWGASAQAVTLLAEIGPEAARRIAFVIDSSSAKQGRRMSGSGIEVLPPTAENLSQVSFVLITATRFEQEIREALARTSSFKGRCAVLRGNAIAELPPLR